MDIIIQQGDNLELLKAYPDNHFDSVVTDCPYGLGKEPNAIKLLQDWIDHGYHEIKGKGFMGKDWDSFVPQPLFWKEVFRVLKPGGYVLAFFGTRTYDWGTIAIRLAGFEIRDMITWHYGSGFPKSLNIGKAMNGMAESVYYQGYGTALKPATEPICVARKPVEGTVADNVLKYGTGGININTCRIGETGARNNGSNPNKEGYSSNEIYGKFKAMDATDYNMGRFPSNVIFDPFMAAELDEQTGVLTSGKPSGNKKGSSLNCYSDFGEIPVTSFGDSGGASRFFYCAKASQDERNAGLDTFDFTRHSDREKTDGLGGDNPRNRSNNEKQNFHPTVKPISLMRYLQRLVTPKGGICLDPYAGSGTSGCAAAFEEINIVLMEMEAEYLPIIEARTIYWKKQANRERYLETLKNSQQKLF